MKKVKGWYRVQVPIYFGNLYIKFSKDFIKDAGRLKINLTDNANEWLGLAFRKSQKKAGAYCILIKRNTPDVIAHECLHVVNYILHDRGITIDTANDEVQAYLLSWVVSQVELVNRKIHGTKK